MFDFYIATFVAHWNNSLQIDVTPLKHIILIPNQPVFLLLLNDVCLAEKQKIPSL